MFYFSSRLSTPQLMVPPSLSPPAAWLDVIQYVTISWPPFKVFSSKFAQISVEFCFCLNFVMARRSFFDQFLFPRKSNKVLLTLQLFSLPHRHWSYPAGRGRRRRRRIKTFSWVFLNLSQYFILSSILIQRKSRRGRRRWRRYLPQVFQIFLIFHLLYLKKRLLMEKQQKEKEDCCI